MLLSRGEDFAAAVTEKLLEYALGRGLEYTDRPAVRRILHDAAADDYRWPSIVHGIVKSTPFQWRRARDLTVASEATPARDSDVANASRADAPALVAGGPAPDGR